MPFIAKLPQKLPGTFIHKPNEEADIREGKNLEVLSIQYFIEVYIKDKDDKPFELFQEKEIDIRQFIFTQEEIEEDLLVQRRIL